MESPQLQPRLITLRSQSPSSRILLRSPVTSDAYSILVRAKDPLCTIYLPHLQPPNLVSVTLASNVKRIAEWRADSLINSLVLVVVLLPDATPGAENDKGPISNSIISEEMDATATIGQSGFRSIDYANKTAEAGIMLNSGPEIRGKGYAVGALEMTFAYGFDHLNLEVIELITHRDNAPMKGLMEKRFGIPAKWREDRDIWEFHATKDWWNLYPGSSGEKMRVEVEESF